VFIQIVFWVVVEKRKEFPIFPKGFPLNGKIFLCFVKKPLAIDYWEGRVKN
jgi:hypothetical protein